MSERKQPGQILIKGLRFHGMHGVKEVEKLEGGWFRVDAIIEADFHPSAQTDDIGDTLDYEKASQTIIEVGTKRRFNLMETLAEAMAAELLKLKGVFSVDLTVLKENPPVEQDVESVGVRIVRGR